MARMGKFNLTPEEGEKIVGDALKYFTANYSQPYGTNLEAGKQAILQALDLTPAAAKVLRIGHVYYQLKVEVVDENGARVALIEDVPQYEVEPDRGAGDWMGVNVMDKAGRDRARDLILGNLEGTAKRYGWPDADTKIAALAAK